MNAAGPLLNPLLSYRKPLRPLKGRVNRITKRATVLVDDPGGELMSGGRRYVRYYVPLGKLRPGLLDSTRQDGR